MKNKRLQIAGFLFIVFWGIIAYSGMTSDKNENIDFVIKNINISNLKSIQIEPYNLNWKMNLVASRQTIVNKDELNQLMNGLKNLKNQNLKKGTKQIWKAILILNFDNKFQSQLKNKNSLKLIVTQTADGLFIERTNIMGYQTYKNDKLSEILEKITAFEKPLGK